MGGAGSNFSIVFSLLTKPKSSSLTNLKFHLNLPLLKLEIFNIYINRRQHDLLGTTLTASLPAGLIEQVVFPDLKKLLKLRLPLVDNVS